MTTTGTYDFNPSAGDIVLGAFGMIQLRRYELTTEHLVNAAFHSNLLMVDFSNRNPNRWAMETQEVALSQNTPTYNLANRTIGVALATIRTTVNNVSTDRVIGPLSATDYEALPTKLQEGAPTSFFFSLLTPTPTISVWPTPDGNTSYTLRVQTFRQMQDVSLPSGVTLDAPYRFLDAFTTGLAARLAVVYPEKLPSPNRVVELETAYKDRFQLAAAQDQESTPMYVQPVLGGYYR